MEFEVWYEVVQDLGALYGERVAPPESWKQAFNKGKKAGAAFYDRYPEHEGIIVRESASA